MKLLILTQHFPPELGAAQTRFHGLCTGLIRQGHDVHVLTTFPSYPSGVVPKEWRGHFFLKHQDQGIHVWRIWSHAAPNHSFHRRILSNLSFSTTASIAALLIPKVEVLVVESHPLLNGFAGLAISAMRRVPLILNVSDLWPENAVQLGVLKNKSIIALCRRMAQTFYRRAARILAMTTYIQKNIVGSGINKEKVVLFRNCVNTQVFRPGLDGERLRQGLGIQKQAFVVLYAGTFGFCNDVETILDAARLCVGENDVRFVLAGDGSEKSKYEARAKRERLTNVDFIGSLPSQSVPELINMAQCTVIALRDLELLRGTLPRKMFEAMACGVPVVLAGQGEPDELLQTAQAGLCVPSQDASAIRDAILFLRDHPERRAEMGLRGREYILKHFDRDARAAELNELITQCVRPRPLRIERSIPSAAAR